MGCDNCADLGHTDDAGKVICPECNGTGNVTAQREADRELGRRVRELAERRRFVCIGAGVNCGWVVKVGLAQIKQTHAADTLDEAVYKAGEGIQ